MKRSWLLVWCVVAVAVVYGVLRVGAPILLQTLLEKPAPVPTPSTLVQWYMALGILATLIYVTTSDRKWREFLGFFSPDQPSPALKALRWVVLAGFPILVAATTFSMVRPAAASPVELRIQHPSSVPERFGKAQNPFRNPTAERLAKFAEEKGMAGEPDDTVRAAFEKDALDRGRAIYTGTCQFCHGGKPDGNGPLADGLTLRPINFTDPGTITTIVEGVALWRVLEGGPGLPTESSPWNSAMPAWKDLLSEDDAWKVVMYEYHAAGVNPREPETLEH